MEPSVMLVARMSFWRNEMVPCEGLQGHSRFVISPTQVSLYPAGGFVLDRAGI